MFLCYEEGEKREWAVTSQRAAFLVADLLPLAQIQLQTRHEFGGSPQANVKPLPSPFHPLPWSNPELDMSTETEDDVRTPLKPARFWEQLWPFYPTPRHPSHPPLKHIAMN